jgi:hypothetical protein
VEAGEVLQVEQIIGGTISNDGPDYAFKLRLVNIDSGKVIAKVTEKIKANPNYELTKGIKQMALKLSDGNKFQ